MQPYGDDDGSPGKDRRQTSKSILWAQRTSKQKLYTYDA